MHRLPHGVPQRTVKAMPSDNSESKTKGIKGPARRTMNLVVVGAVATAPLVGCGNDKPAVVDAAPHMDATASPDGSDASVDGTLAMDTAGKDAGIDGGKDAAADLEDDASTDSYPDGVRG